MERNLTEKEKDQLEQWIGTGPKTFTLLYAISQHGCNPDIFHQTCDNQGPTVTVLYNQYGSVYGGFTSVRWQSQNRGYVRDDKAFLFQLRYNRCENQNKFLVANSDYAVYHDSTCGPCFGHPFELCTFQNEIYPNIGVYPLNGHLNIGNTFHNNRLRVDQINNNTMNVTELEVYRVEDGHRLKVWRTPTYWNGKLSDEIKEEIVAFKPASESKVSEARILMIGPVGAGKSSFYNTIDSIFRGRITQRASSGSAEQSVTMTYTPYTVKARSGASLNFRLYDTRGLEESMGIDLLEFNYLLDGNIPDYYEFNPTSAIGPRSPGFKSAPDIRDVVHCAVFVLDSTAIEVLPTKILEKIKEFRGLLFKKGIPQIILLTKIDKLCTEVQKDVSSVYRSSTVKQAVANASQLLGLPEANVLPVKSYESETELDQNVDILALLSLRKMLHCTEDFMLNQIERWNVQVRMEKLKI